MNKYWKKILPSFLAIFSVVAATALFYPGRNYFAKGQWALLYLLIVVFVASFGGVGPAVLAATLSFFVWNYFFLPPFHTFSIDDPKDWISLFIFLIVGIIMGLQTGRLKEREQKIAQAEALKESDRLKTTFISSVSHELKTPLASIMATITNLLEKDFIWDKEIVCEELNAIHSDLDKLNNSINSLIDLSRLESSAWRPKQDWFELGEIIGTTLNRISQKQRSRIECFLPTDLPEIRVDFDQISRALQNLLENALIYSDPNLMVKLGAVSEKKEIKIWVEDNGPGIQKHEIDKIFNKFYRGSASEKSQAGTGLGLTIAAEIVKSHGGKIWAENILPHGIRMIISLPREKKA